MSFRFEFALLPIVAMLLRFPPLSARTYRFGSHCMRPLY